MNDSNFSSDFLSNKAINIRLCKQNLVGLYRTIVPLGLSTYVQTLCF